MQGSVKAFLLIVTIVLGAGRSRADETYYMVVFGSQRPDNLPRFSHTFAAFIKVDDPKKKTRPELAVISWLPDNKNIELKRLKGERGKNCGLDETCAWAAGLGARITGFGPFQIQKELYESARRRAQRLHSGAILYKALDLGMRSAGTGTNCIHAVSDLDIAGERVVTARARGEEASRMVARSLGQWIVQPQKTHPDVAGRLGLDRFQITYRGLD